METVANSAGDSSGRDVLLDVFEDNAELLRAMLASEDSHNNHHQQAILPPPPSTTTVVGGDVVGASVQGYVLHQQPSIHKDVSGHPVPSENDAHMSSYSPLSSMAQQLLPSNLLSLAQRLSNSPQTNEFQLPSLPPPPPVPPPPPPLPSQLLPPPPPFHLMSSDAPPPPPLQSTQEKPSVVIVAHRIRTSEYRSAVKYTVGTRVIVQGDRGVDIGVITGAEPSTSNEDVRTDTLPTIVREATASEVDFYLNRVVPQEAWVLQHVKGLTDEQAEIAVSRMTFVDCEFQFDMQKLTIYYKMDHFVRFLPLAKKLFAMLHCRIYFQDYRDVENGKIFKGPQHHSNNNNQQQQKANNNQTRGGNGRRRYVFVDQSETFTERRKPTATAPGGSFAVQEGFE